VFPVNEGVAVAVYLVVISGVYSYFVLGVIYDVCVHLNIYCFRIPYKGRQD
jgi:hypothetical protein